MWVSMCPQPSQTCVCKRRHIIKGPVGAAKKIPCEVYALANFVYEGMLKQIAKHTNQCARRDLRTIGKNTDRSDAKYYTSRKSEKRSLVS